MKTDQKDGINGDGVKNNSQGRIEFIDSLRGLASLEVVFTHFLSVLPILTVGTVPYFIVRFFSWEPLHILASGHEAVVFFFVLSGFVLTLPYIKDSSLHYGPYLVRRFFRIYVPFFVVVSLSLVLYKLNLCRSSFAAETPWLRAFWSVSLNRRLIFHIFTMTGQVTGYELTKTTWTLVHELRISLFFPFLALLLLKIDWKWGCLLGLSFAFSANLMERFHILDWTDLNQTIFYTSFFIYGSILAKHRQDVVPSINRLSRIWSILLVTVVYVLYNWGLRWPHSFYFDHFFNDTVVGFAAVGVIALALSWQRFQNFLSRSPIHILGKISFSLYLIHPLILLFCLHYLHGPLTMFGSACLAVPLSLLLGYWFNRWVEDPFHILGKSLARKLKEKTTVPKT